MEARILLSAYSLSQPGYFGANATGANPYSTLVADAGGNLFGTTSSGGIYGGGTIFEIAAGSNALTTLASFSGPDGLTPQGGLALDTSGNLYGTTYRGGAGGDGTVFEIAHDSAAITAVASFNGTNGANPTAGVTLDPLGNLYGTTNAGGANNEGAAFAIADGSGAITALASFSGTNSISGSHFEGPLALDASGNLYGAAPIGGANSDGAVFEIASGTSAITTLASFNLTNGSAPVGGVLRDAAGNLFGATGTGGASSEGTVFEIANGSATITALVSFNGTNGSNPAAGLTLDGAGNLYGTTPANVFEIANGSNTVTTLGSFNGANGSFPQAAVTLDASGNLYGTTSSGGANNSGTVFKMAGASNTITTLVSFTTPSGSNPIYGVTLDAAGNLYGVTTNGPFEVAHGSGLMTTLASFNAAVGWPPSDAPSLDASGNLFGTTREGGAHHVGTVFEVAAGSGSITALASLNGTAEASAQSPLVLDAAGDIYGTADRGGAYGYGAVFEIACGSNAITVLASFTQSNAGGLPGYPGSAVTLDASGNLYGTTVAEGSANDGTVFEIPNGSGTITTLASFNGSTALAPSGPVVFDASGNLYGCTSGGGPNGDGTLFEIAKGSGAITVLASFTGANGQAPKGPVAVDASGNLFGATYEGGANNDGAVFELARGSNAIRTLLSFSGSNQSPTAGLALDAFGNLYGATRYGGVMGYGTVFELSPNTTVTLALANGSNPSNANQSLTYTVTVTGNVPGGVPDGDSVTLVDASNNNAVVATGTLSGGTATLTVPAGTLLAGTHNLVAAYAGGYSGAGLYAASESAPYVQTVQAAVTSVVVNGNNPALAGVQRSMVDGILYTFSQAVTLAASNAFTIGIHAGQTGTVPTLAWSAINPDASGASTQWAVTFSGAGVVGGSIANGVYDITLDPTTVTVEANPAATVAARPADTFYRLYGDVTGDGRVNNADYNLLLNSFNLKPGEAGYLAALDASGTGSRINNADYNLFLNNFNAKFAGFTATI